MARVREADQGDHLARVGEWRKAEMLEHTLGAFGTLAHPEDPWTPAELDQLSQWAGEDCTLRSLADKPAI